MLGTETRPQNSNHFLSLVHREQVQYGPFCFGRADRLQN